MRDTPKGIKIVENIFKTAGVSTLEGTISPLIFGEQGQSHYIEMQPGMYCEEHPHETESIIYTAKGKWVLCSSGKRVVMETGSLFWFGPQTPTGYEVPFDESVVILIFKSQKMVETTQSMIDYLENLAHKLRKQNDSGTPFTYAELPENHPAKIFAKGLLAADTSL